ncbi:hypothetical protein Tco_1341658 [Tanacetum coccineum]
MSCFEDINLFNDFEEEFPAIVFKDASMPKPESPRELTISTLYTHEIEFDFKMSYEESDDEDYTFIYDEDSFSYKLVPIDELKSDSQGFHSDIDIRIPSEDFPVNSFNDVIDNNTDPNELDKNVTANNMAQLPVRAQRHLWLIYKVLDFEGMTEEMGMDIDARLSMRHRDAEGLVVFTSHD